MSHEHKGATAKEWYTFDFELGLGAHLLPSVPAADDVEVVPGSALEGKIGKIPSALNRAGLAHGIVKWQKRVIEPAEIQVWSKDRRLNLCVRTGGISGVYAIDVDVADIPQANDILTNISTHMGAVFIRRRSNSAKFLVPFRIEGNPTCKKEIIRTDKGIIEFLADGQQFVAAGSHSSGYRYEWTPYLPDTLPSVTLVQLNQMMTTLSQTFAASGQATTSPIVPVAESETTTTTLMTTIDVSSTLNLNSALLHLAPFAEDNSIWSEVGYALLTLKTTGFQLWIEFCKNAPKYDFDAACNWWNTHSGQQTRTDYRHIFNMAKQRGWKFTSTASAEEFQPVADAGDGSADTTGEGLSAGSAAEGGQDVPTQPRPIIRIAPGALGASVRDVTTALSDTVYTQGTVLVRLSREKLSGERDEKDTDETTTQKKGTWRDPNQLRLIQVTSGWARVHLSDIATTMRCNAKGEWVVIDPPPDLINTFLDMGDNPMLRELIAIQRSPYVRLDGDICDKPGYDERSRTIYIPSTEYPPVPDKPTIGDAHDALAALLAPFAEFPFSTGAARSAFVAHILTEAARVALDRVPMFFYSAPDAGTGKTLLSEMPAMIVHGVEPSVRPWAIHPEEMRKTLFASLLAGDRSIAFDNLNSGGKIRSAELCAFLTSARWKDRKLGVSETLETVNTAVVSASGNNITPVGDLSRRSIVCRLDANSARLKERRFNIADLRGHVMIHRPDLLVNALLIIRAHQLNPLMDGPVLLPSFERWSRIVRNALLWLGMDDPVETQKAETDDETGSVSNIFEILVHAFGARTFSAVDIAKLVGSFADADGLLLNALINMGCKEPSNPRDVGYWLRGMRDRIGYDHKLIGEANRHGVSWKFVKVNEELI